MQVTSDNGLLLICNVVHIYHLSLERCNRSSDLLWWILGHVVTGGQVQTVGFFRIGELVRGRNTGSHALAVVNIHQPELSLENCKLRSTPLTRLFTGQLTCGVS